ncbi:MAG: HAMP domain-containing histidine kinase [Roseitalea sp.]|nr:HAMP domain-containing histidine kinase [Roseitalea sp.]MBO6720512.1 HAMP domain-containing histidine kinase [Roseitalea sp.]MBO6743659.1 HAMP domain-containing histidine kinase [Roseitalea sp.]
MSIVLRFLDSLSRLHRERAASGGRVARRAAGGALAAAVSGGSVCLVVVAALGAGDVAPSLVVAATISAALFALIALVTVRSVANWPAAGASVRSNMPVAADIGPVATSAPATVIEDTGEVWRPHDVAIDAIAPLDDGDRLLDRVHVGDRVAFLHAMARARSANAMPVGLNIRLNRAASGDRQNYEAATLVLCGDPTGKVQANVAFDVEPAPLGEQTGAQEDVGQLAMVSHELRTPLNAIIGFADLIRGDALGSLPVARQREYGDLIHDAATHLLAVVNAMLDVSKIGAGRYTINREVFDLDCTVRDVAMMIAPRAQAKGIHVNLHLEKVATSAQADRRAVRQIVTNLLANAVKFTPQHGCVTIEAETNPEALVLTVSDTGIGISPEDIDKLGRPYAQIDNSYTRECEGTGLGLSLVKGLAGLHGGEMRIESTPDIGTRVTVRIPRDAPQTAGDGTQDSRVTELRPVRPAQNTDNGKEITDAPRRFG